MFNNDQKVGTREKWGSKYEFFLASLGYSVGQGALTRFPYVVMKNGGGAFLIPFTLVLVFAAIPLFYLEVLLGQFSGRSPLTLWSLCPAFKGIGYSTTALALIGAVVFMAFTWPTFFFWSSMAVDVPWRHCNNEWNTKYCVEGSNLTSSFVAHHNASLLAQAGKNYDSYANITKIHSASEEFWNYHALGVHDKGLSEFGDIQWPMAITHLFCWLVVFLCTMKGAVTAGKVVYVTATLPFLLLTVLLVRGLTLEGSLEGVMFFVKPEFSKLLDWHVWLEAAIQVFYQLGPGWGSLITMASYNEFHQKCYWNAVIVSLANLAASFVGGLTVFSILGFMANRSKVAVPDVAGSGPGLAFVAYPEAVAQMPFSQFWALLFFLMLMTVGIDSMFGNFDCFVSGILDFFPRLRKKQIVVTAMLAAMCFSISLVFCTQSGILIFQLLDWYASVLTFTVTCFLECIVVCYIYGLKRFNSDVALMLGSPPNFAMGIAWMFVAPLITAAMFVVGFWNLKTPIYEFTGYVFPEWAVAIGWVVALVSFIPTPIMFVYVIARAPGNLVQKFKNSFKPSPKWLPNNQEIVEDYRRRWYNQDQVKMTTVAVVTAKNNDKMVRSQPQTN